VGPGRLATDASTNIAAPPAHLGAFTPMPVIARTTDSYLHLLFGALELEVGCQGKNNAFGPSLINAFAQAKEQL